MDCMPLNVSGTITAGSISVSWAPTTLTIDQGASLSNGLTLKYNVSNSCRMNCDANGNLYLNSPVVACTGYSSSGWGFPNGFSGGFNG